MENPLECRARGFFFEKKKKLTQPLSSRLRVVCCNQKISNMKINFIISFLMGLIALTSTATPLALSGILVNSTEGVEVIIGEVVFDPMEADTVFNPLCSTFTNASGSFAHTCEMPDTQGIFYVSFIDCNGTVVVDYSNYYPEMTIALEFWYCADTINEDCLAYFTIDSLQSNEDNVVLVFGGVPPSSETNVLWTFGDGSSSNEIYPLHSYITAGTYEVCLTISNDEFECTDTFCRLITVGGQVGGGSAQQQYSLSVVPSVLNVKEENDSNDLVIFPNPAENSLNISLYAKQSESVIVRVHSLSGALFSEERMTVASGTAMHTIDIETLPSGMYVISLTGGATLSQHKVFQKL